MTKDLHGNSDLVLNENSRRSLSNLSQISKKVCISGEGDPLMAHNVVTDIIKSGPDFTHYELITSSFWKESKTTEYLKQISTICDKKHCKLTYRLSIDKFHSEELKSNPFKSLLNIFSRHKLENISMDLRSITGQEEFVFKAIKLAFDESKFKFSIIQDDDLCYKVLYNSKSINLAFKPTVSPSKFNYKEEWNLERYISYLEKKRGNKFHLGLLNDDLESPHFDITINPNGDLVLYGLEPYILGNITKEVLDYGILKSRMKENFDLYNLIKQNFSDRIVELQKKPRSRELLLQTNNPFWIIRNLERQN